MYDSFQLREIYRGRRWNFDIRFSAPVAILTSGEHVFVNDVVSLSYANVGMVLA